MGTGIGRRVAMGWGLCTVPKYGRGARWHGTWGMGMVTGTGLGVSIGGYTHTQQAGKAGNICVATPTNTKTQNKKKNSIEKPFGVFAHKDGPKAGAH